MNAQLPVQAPPKISTGPINQEEQTNIGLQSENNNNKFLTKLKDLKTERLFSIAVLLYVSLTNLIGGVLSGYMHIRFNAVSRAPLAEEKTLLSWLSKSFWEMLIYGTIGFSIFIGLYKKIRIFYFLGFIYLAYGMVNEILKVAYHKIDIANLLVFIIGFIALFGCLKNS